MTIVATPPERELALLKAVGLDRLAPEQRDLAVNLAERTLFLSTQPLLEAPFEFAEISKKTLAMLSGSLGSLLQQNAKRAREVRANDNDVDAINRGMYVKISTAIRKNPDHVEQLLCYLSVSRNLERIADCATNIAEAVIYLTEGEIVRHKPVYPEG